MADFEDDNASVVIEAPVTVTSLSVLDVDSVEIVGYDDVITDDTDDEMPVMASEDEMDDPNVVTDDPDETDESDEAEDVDRNKDDDTQTKLSYNVIIVMSMFLIHIIILPCIILLTLVPQ